MDDAVWPPTLLSCFGYLSTMKRFQDKMIYLMVMKPLIWPVLKSDYKPHEFKYANCLITAKKKDDHKPRHTLII